MSESPKVLVIGAGNAGLVFLRNFLKKKYNVVCFEKANICGGMWNFQLKDNEEQTGYAELNTDGSVSCANSCIQLNTSKYTIFSSDVIYDGLVKLPDSVWLSGKEFLDTLNDVADKYNLLPRIKFNTEVLRLFKENNGWKVTYKDKDGVKKEEHFDFVVCSTGGYSYPKFPVIKDMNTFKGIAVHSCQVRLEKQLFSGKNVLVFGSSFSGTDMAYFAAKHGAKKVYWNETRVANEYNHWMLDRCPPKSDPMKTFDLKYTRQIWFENPALLLEYLNSLLTPIYTKEPDAALNHPGDRLAIADIPYLLEAEKEGKIQKVGPVTSMTETGAILESGSTISDVDVVIYATGFETKFPILDHVWPVEKQIKNELYYHMFPTDENLQGLAVTGANECYTPTTSIYELQSRWLATYWLTKKYNKDGKIFTKEESDTMKKSVQEVRAAKPKDNKFHFILDGFSVAESIANDIGCVPPDFRKLINTGARKDVELGVALLKGPMITIQYRIQGPDAYPNAGEHFVNIARGQIGEDKFEAMVKEAMENPQEFFRKNDIKSDEYKVKPCFTSIIKTKCQANI